MLRAEVTDAGVYAADNSGVLLGVGAPDWETIDRDPRFSRDTETTVSGVVSHLRLPPFYPSVGRPERSPPLPRAFRSTKLSPGKHVVRVDGPVGMEIRFESAAALTDPGTRSALLAFPGPTPVTLAFDGDPRPRGSVTVPRTPEGVARALSAAAVGHRTDTPDRSRPEMRGPPPAIDFGEATRVPEVVADRRPPCNVSLRLPADLRYLFPAAPLAYYLGAEVSVAPEVTPTIRLPDRSIALPGGREFGRAVADHLRRTFLLDCLVRTAGPYGQQLAEARHLDALNLDAEALYDAPVADRFAAYLDAPFEAVTDSLPEWHLAMYVAPEYDHVRTLPQLLTDVPAVYRPRTEPLECKERLSRALDDFYRAPAGGDYEAASVDPVKPILGDGRTHGWLADEIPIEVFKTVPAAYERSRRRTAGVDAPDDEALSVVTVLNDEGMSREYDEAARVYENHARRDVEVDVRKCLGVDDLASVFEAEHDVVHYIGHCDDAGLRCRDGHFSASTLRESNAETFILNACGSFYEGLDLVRRGSVAGAVTFEKVLDRHAARVGTAFARLLVHGFSIGRALELARRRVIMGTDYVVVGDGTHALARGGGDVPVAARLTRTGTDAYVLTYEANTPRMAGGWYRPPGCDDRARLHGSSVEETLDAEGVAAALEDVDAPVIFDGDIHWSDELVSRFR